MDGRGRKGEKVIREVKETKGEGRKRVGSIDEEAAGEETEEMKKFLCWMARISQRRQQSCSSGEIEEAWERREGGKKRRERGRRKEERYSVFVTVT
jgi:hypothetical protein